MRGIEQRLERLEEAISSQGCVCQQEYPIAIVAVQPDWTPEQIHQAEADAAISCPVHGRIMRPVLRLSGSDVSS